MARFFNDHGLPAVALTGESPDEDAATRPRSAACPRSELHLRRRPVQRGRRLARGRYSPVPPPDRKPDGLSPAIRSWSATARRQGLFDSPRFHRGPRREFRFAPASGPWARSPAGRLDREIEHGFPHLPSGCSSDWSGWPSNGCSTTSASRSGCSARGWSAAFATWAGYSGRPPSITEALEYLDTSLDELLKTRSVVTPSRRRGSRPQTPRSRTKNDWQKGYGECATSTMPDQIRWLLALPGRFRERPDPGGVRPSDCWKCCTLRSGGTKAWDGPLRPRTTPTATESRSYRGPPR